MNSLLWTLSWILMIGGGIGAVVSALSKAYYEEHEKFRGKTTATVVEIMADEPDRKGKAQGIHDYYYAVFAYYAAGRLYKIRYPRGGNPCPFTMNQEIEIQYDTEEPKHFKIYRRTQRNFRISILYYGGLFLVLAGGILFLLCAMRIL